MIRVKYMNMAMRVLGLVAIIVGLVSNYADTSAGKIYHSSGPLGEIMINLHDDKVELTKYQKLNRSALEQLAILEYRKAFSLLKQALELEPDSPEAYINYGLAHYQRKEFPASERAIKRALELDPENERAWYWHSRVMLIKGEMLEARESAARAVDYNAGEDWKYLDWQAILLFDHGHYQKATEASSLALKQVRAAYATVDRAIRLEERREEVKAIEQDTEIVREFGGVSREVPVTRLQTEYKDAPDEWLSIRGQLETHMSNVAFRHAMSLLKLGKRSEAQIPLETAFLKNKDHLGEGLYQFVFMNYEDSAKSLKRSNEFGNASLASLFAHLVNQIALNDNTGVNKTLRKLKRRIQKNDINWAADVLAYYREYAPEVNTKGLSAKKQSGDENRALASFYKAQLHCAQRRLDLARPFLDQAITSLFDFNFEAKAAEAQLALFYDS